jgi:Mn-dependent DtxR family transcriptional regulator
MSTKEDVLKVFVDSEEPLRPGAVVEKLGVDKKDVDKAIKELKKEEKIYSPKRCFYTAK